MTFCVLLCVPVGVASRVYGTVSVLFCEVYVHALNQMFKLVCCLAILAIVSVLVYYRRYFSANVLILPQNSGFMEYIQDTDLQRLTEVLPKIVL